jgi:hypothetical protein
MPRGKKNTKGKKGGNSTDASLVASHHAAARGDVLFDSSDLIAKPRSWVLTQKPPKNFLTLPHWLQATWDTSLTVSAAGAVVENAQGFTLAQFPDAAAVAALFDQYCIYSVSSRATLELSAASGVANSGYGVIASALDFDSSGTVSSLANIEKYGSCQIAELVPGKSYERFVHPVLVDVTGGSNNTSPTGTSMSRAWVNSNYQSVPHFGIRYMTANNQSGTGPIVRFFFTGVIGVRNNY